MEIMEIECSSPAYERLQRAGLIEKISQRSDEVLPLFMHHPFVEEGAGERVLNWAKEFTGGSSGEIQVSKDILDFEDRLLYEEKQSDLPLRWGVDDYPSLAGLLMDHPSFLARVCVGNDVFKFEEYDFPSRKRLEEAISAFCIGNKSSSYISRNRHVWRNKDTKNIIELNMHGDLYAEQIDTSANVINERGLFSDITDFDAAVKISGKKRIYAYQDWSVFLLASLKYAQALGLERTEYIVNWKRILEREGSVGTNTAEAHFGSGLGNDVSFLMMLSLAGTSSDEVNSMVLRCRDLIQIPIFEEEKLVYYSANENGECKLPSLEKFVGNSSFSKQVSYDKDDLPNVLRATYKFFARDKSIMNSIMDSFNRQIS